MLLRIHQGIMIAIDNLSKYRLVIKRKRSRRVYCRTGPSDMLNNITIITLPHAIS